MKWLVGCLAIISLLITGMVYADSYHGPQALGKHSGSSWNYKKKQKYHRYRYNRHHHHNRYQKKNNHHWH